MLNPELWTEGLTTMAVGMGIVFSFLVILVFAIVIMAKVVGFLNKICPVAVTETKTKKLPNQANDEIALAVGIAMIQKCK